MENGILYSLSAQTQSLKKGNFWIGTNDVSKSSAGYWAGISPTPGGYTIYVNKASQGPSIVCPSDDAGMIQWAQRLSGQTFGTAAAALAWFATQTDRMVFNIDYPTITTDQLKVCIDFGFSPSYPRSGSTAYDIGTSGLDGTLYNSPAYSATGGGTLVMDGADDYVQLPTSSVFNYYQKNITIELWVYVDPSLATSNNYQTFVDLGSNNLILGGFRSGLTGVPALYVYFGNAASFATTPFGGYIATRTYTYPGKWNHIAFTANYSTNTNSFYVNGSLYGTSSYTGSPVNQSNNLYLGVNSIYGERMLGNYSSFKYYEKALSASEVLGNYQNTLPRVLGYDIVGSGLTFYMDAGYSTSYSGSGTSSFNVAGASGGDGTLINGVSFSSSNGGSFVFDGTDDYISLSYSSEVFNFGTRDFTYTCWYKCNTNDLYQRLLSIGAFATITNFQFERQGQSAVVVHVDSQLVVFSSSNPIGTWQNYAVVRRSGVVTVYQNSISIGSSASALAGPITSTTTPTIGSNGPQVSTIFNGSIPVTSMYNRALSASEILQNFNAQKSRFGL